MSGDIDIEEHDLMENPKIRTIFPDLTLLKKEILDPYNDESMQHGDFATDMIVDRTLQFNNSPLCKTNQNMENDSNINIQRKIKLEINSTSNQLDFRLGGAKISNSVPFFSNKIILGSKPPGPSYDKKLAYEAKIFLKDINNYLIKSERYCMICQILFPKIHMLKHHRLVNHKIDKSDKLLNMHRNDFVRNSQIHKRDSIINKNKGNSINKCFHCNVLYPSQGLLIDHLYDVLEKKRAGISENVFTNCERIPDNTSEGCKIITKDCGGYKTISRKKSFDDEDYRDSKKRSKDYRGQTKPVESKTCERKFVHGGECETISDDDRDCETTSVDARDYETISINEECSESKFNEIEILCDISCDEVFQCAICSYYFQKQKFYKIHMLRKHDNKIKNINIVKFNPKCKFCSGLYTGVKQYNAHLHKMHSKMIFSAKLESDNFSTDIGKIHQKYENKTENNLKITQGVTPVSQMIENSVAYNDLFTASFMLFKSVLFKCLKCDVHFLSPNLATNHIVHNEMLINWKCSLCKIFFKKNDEAIHSKQHLYTNSFTIYSLDAIDLNRILIKCSKCTVHYPKDNFTYHLKLCKTNIQTWYCSVCDIMIDMHSKRTHKSFHIDRSNKKSDFIIIDDSIINTQTTNAISNDLTREINEVEKSASTTESEETDVDDYSADESEIIYPLSNLKVKDQPRTLKTVKRKIDDTQNSRSTKKLKRLKIPHCNSDKNMFYLKLNCKSHIQPKVLLNLTYCHYCECFISMYYKLDIHVERRCIHILKRVCNVCGLTLTAKSIGGHREFHKLNPGLKLQDFTFYDIETNKIILPPIPKYPKCDHCDTHFINKIQVSKHICNEKQQHLLCDICDMKFSNVTLNLHISFHGYYLKSKPLIEEISEAECDSVKDRVELDQPKNSRQVASEQEVQSKHVELEQKKDETNKHNDHCDEGMVLMYTCEDCSVTVNSYDQLIEHCHSHYDNSYRNIKTKECAQCNLIFEHSSISCHNELHVSGLAKESFKIFAFDIYHFGCSNWEWLNHVFKSLSHNKIEEIIKDSIYRFEYRIKLDASKQGSPELTLYQCIKCGIFIDGCTIYKHRVICQGGNKKYPCEYCGIALLSTAHRSQHIKIHEQANISVKSYRIVIFNRVTDKTLNDAMAMKNNHYVLHQCRICNGVVDWKLLKNHMCNMDDLKKCNHCGLLIYNNDYDKHVSKHRSCNTFIASNMKVVLFGQSTMENNERNDRACSFNGIVYDYTFYKCIKCEVCIQHLRPCSKHFCLIDAAKWKCSRCDLVFDEGKKKGHRAIHNSDIEFTKDTICVIPFDPQLTYERLEKDLKSKSKTGSFVREKDHENVVDSIKEKTDVMYKCFCGLHYLTEESAKEHTAKKKCMYLKKNAKQTCSKCNLVFTSEILFKHLLKHHGDKNIKYTYDIVNVCEESDGK